MNYLGVAAAGGGLRDRAATMDIDLVQGAARARDRRRRAEVYLKDIWPTPAEVQRTIDEAVRPEHVPQVTTRSVFEGDEHWQELAGPGRATASRGTSELDLRAHAARSSRACRRTPAPVTDISGARVLALLGDSVTTDHISPAGAIKKDTPAAEYLIANGVEQKDFNSYGSRRGNHEVMVRGTFANIRLRNQMAPGTRGWLHPATCPTATRRRSTTPRSATRRRGSRCSCSRASEYGSGSSRDWAAKGTKLLGVRAVIAESYERIHRSNLVGMGVLPLQYLDGDSAESLGLTGEEEFSITGVDGEAKEVTVRADDKEFKARVRIDTPKEVSTTSTAASCRSCSDSSWRRRWRFRRPCAGCSLQPARPGRAGAGRGVPRRGVSVRRRGHATTPSARRSRACPARAGGKSVAIVGHIDEIGLIVPHIDDEGLLCGSPASAAGTRSCSSASAWTSPRAAASSPASWARSRSTSCKDEDRKKVAAELQAPAHRHRRLGWR